MRPKKLFIEALRWYLEDKCFEGASLILSGLYAEGTDGSEPTLQCLRQCFQSCAPSCGMGVCMSVCLA